MQCSEREQRGGLMKLNLQIMATFIAPRADACGVLEAQS
jgi:hypothetical protein